MVETLKKLRFILNSREKFQVVVLVFAITLMAFMQAIGGAPRSLVPFRGDLIRSWVKLGLSVVALSAPAREDIELKIWLIGADFRPVSLKRDSINPLKDLSLIWQLRKIIKNEKPDLIFAYTVKPIIYSALAAGKATKAKFYFMVTGLGYAFTGISIKQRLVKMLLKCLNRAAFSRSEIVFIPKQGRFGGI